jgi:hypothetical protein
MQARRDGLSEPLRSKLSALSLDAVVSWWGRPADLLISDDPFNLQILGQFLVNENQTRQLCVNLDRLAQFAYDTFFCVPVCSAELEASRAIQEGTPQ